MTFNWITTWMRRLVMNGPGCGHTDMHTGDAGIALIKRFESCRLKAYPDPYSPRARANTEYLRGHITKEHWLSLSGAPWTIGWGDTGPDVHEGLVITQADADSRLAKAVARTEGIVRSLVTVPLTQQQFDALVCFTYNVGHGTPEHPGLAQSALLARLNAGRPAAVVAEGFMHFTHSRGVVSDGLVRRRRAEQSLFLS